MPPILADNIPSPNCIVLVAINFYDNQLLFLANAGGFIISVIISLIFELVIYKVKTFPFNGFFNIKKTLTNSQHKITRISNLTVHHVLNNVHSG